MAAQSVEAGSRWCTGMTRTPVTTSEYWKILELRLAGQSCSQIGLAVGRPRGTVSRVCRSCPIRFYLPETKFKESK